MAAAGGGGVGLPYPCVATGWPPLESDDKYPLELSAEEQAMRDARNRTCSRETDKKKVIVPMAGGEIVSLKPLGGNKLNNGNEGEKMSQSTMQGMIRGR